MELDEKTKNKLLRMAKIADDGELGIFELLEELFERLEIAKGDKGEKGEPGRDGVDGRDGIDGKDGKDGRDGKNGRDGLDGRDGENGKNGENGKDGKDGSPDTPEQIIEKINESGGKIKREKVEGLDDELTAIRNLPRGGGARRVFQPKRDDLSSLCDGANKTFYLSKAPMDEGTVMVYGTDFPVILRPTIDFTIANKVLTLTDSVPAPSQGATLVCTYFS